jgi:ligand-binding sensor domain-containing protein/serine phosphatase RsbU (regulator of sigma subunit)
MIRKDRFFLKSIICLLLFVFIVFKLNAQVPRFDSFKILKNKKNVEVSSIFQDNKGFIWIGTNYGLVKYDGIDFILYTEKDSLYENHITAIGEDAENNLWIGHKSGKITQYINDEFTKFDPEEGSSNEPISSIYRSMDQTIWFSTMGEGVYYYSGINRKRIYNLNTDDGLLDNYVYSLVQDSVGLIYFATDKGISIYNPIKQKFVDQITMTNGLPDNIVKHLVLIGNDLWIAMEDAGICKYSLKSKQFSRITDWKFGSINDFIYLSYNELWISTKSKGVIRCSFDSNDKSWYTLFDNTKNKLTDIRTETVFKDRESNIWVGTKNGLSVRKNNPFEFLTQNEDFDISNIFSFIIDNQGNYWIASDQGLFIVKREEMGGLSKKLLFHDSNNPYSFISLYKDYSGNIWAGTYGFGVFRINPITLEIDHYTSKNGLSNDNIIHISGDKESIWFSTLGGGVTRLFTNKNNSFKIYTDENGLGSNYVYSTFTDSNNRTWIATDGGGVSYYLDDSIHRFSNPALDSVNKTVYSIIEDCNHNIWFNCANYGLYKYDGFTFVNYSEENGLKTNYIQGLTTDNLGNPVIISNEGIDKYIVKDSSFEYYGYAYGVAYQDPNLNSVFKDNDGNIWVGCKTGILKVINQPEEFSNVLPTIFITQKSLFFNPIENNKSTFRYKQNHLTFQYSGLWYRSSDNLVYRYKLEGYDIDWNIETNLRLVTYSNLPPGQYKFIVQVNYAGGKWIGNNDSEFSFKIKKPFWKTIWFITSTIIIILLLIYGYIQNRLMNLQKAKDVLEEEVKKRTAQIMQQKEEIETQRDEIEAQRNYVMEQKDKIEIQNKSITSSIEYASKIQQAVLPPLENFENQLGEYFVYFKPRDIVSGDFYYLNTKNNKIIIAAADCTGHGVPGAFMSLLGIAFLNQIINELPVQFNAATILNSLRKEIKNSLRQTGKEGEAKDGMDISLCILDKDLKELDYAGAYNPLILIRNNEIVKYNADKMPIGIFIKENESFSNNRISVEKGDMLYLFSDGFQDQFGGPYKRKFLPKNLYNLLLNNSDKPLKKQIEIIDATFRHWKDDEPQVDDILIIGFKV